MKPIKQNKFVENNKNIVHCPQCQTGQLVKRNGKFGDFYGCTNFRSGCRQTLKPSQYEKLSNQSRVQKPTFTPTPEQESIFSWVNGMAGKNSPGSLLVEACAGSGKTTTIGQAIKNLRQTGETDLVYLVFNTKNREEAQAKGLPAQTTHQHGFAAIRSYVTGKVRVESHKTANVAKELIGQRMDDMKWLIKPTVKLIGLAKNNLMEPSPDNIEILLVDYDIDLHPQANHSELHNFVWAVWEKVIVDFHTIDFDDMLFLPVYHNLNVKKYKWVFADEVQDFNNAQIELVKMTFVEYGVFVGDRNQSIYGFRGASLTAMDDIKQQFNSDEKPLSVTFRVPRVGVTNINENFSHIKFSCLDTAQTGKIDFMAAEQLTQYVQDDDLVLCRMNAPLVSYVFELLKMGRKATIIGRDLASQLTNLVERFSNGNNQIDTETLLKRLEEYRYFETQKLNNMDREMAAEIVNDKIDTINAISDGCSNAQCILNRIDTIFSKDAGTGVSFSTVHRAKGAEAKRVFILKPELMPHPHGNEIQESNIQYVAETRFLEEMYYVC